MRGYNFPVIEPRNFSQTARVSKDAHVLLFMIRPLWRMPAAEPLTRPGSGLFFVWAWGIIEAACGS